MTRALLVTVLVFALTGPACGGGGGSDCTSKNATKLSGTLKVEGLAFSPKCFSVASGSTISIANKDATAHNFTVKNTDVAVPLLAGGTGKATAPAKGTYDFVCTIHPSMTGTMVVT
jgi:plastocyanin